MRAAQRILLCRKKVRGSTLIEVLIAVLVLSLGLLGALKMQTAGMRLNADSRYSVMATTYAQDALDAVTFNPLGEKSTWTSITCSTTASALTGTPQTWLTRLKSDLPSGCANVSCDSSARSCTVKIDWTLPGQSDKTEASYVIYN
jgi:type IV pilus assembly protein PilV